MRIFTKSLTGGTLVLQASDNVNQLSIQANASSSCTIQGNITYNGIDSDAMTLENGESLTLTTTPNSPIEGITITWVSGTIDVLIAF